MQLISTVDIDAPPGRIYPLFLNAQMDERLPLAFRFGLPKAMSCSIIRGDGGVGSIRRCITTRGFMEPEFRQIGSWIIEVVEGLARNGEDGNSAVETRVRAEVEALCARFPFYPGL